MEAIWMIQKAVTMGNWWLAASSWQTCPLRHNISYRVFCQNIEAPRGLRPPTAQIWHHATSGSSQNWNHLWKGNDFRPWMRFRKIWQGSWWRFQQRILQSVLNSGRDTERTVWGPKAPTLKGTEVSLSYVQCFLYLVFSSINFHFSYYMAGYLLDRSCMSMCARIYIHIHMY